LIRKYINSLIIILVVSSTVLVPVSANDNGLTGIVWDRSVEGEITQILVAPHGEQVLITTDKGYVYRFDEAGEINLPNNEPLRVAGGPIDKIVANSDLGRFGYVYKNDTHSIAALPILGSDYYYIESDVYDLGIDCNNNGDFWVVAASEPGEDKSYLGIFTSSGRGGWIAIDAVEPSSIVLDKTNSNYLVGISASNDKELISIDLGQIPSGDDLEVVSNLIDLDDLIPPYLRYYSLEMLPQDHTTNLIFDINTDGEIEFFGGGNVKAWGSDGYGQVSGVPDGLKPGQIAGGAYHNLAITPDGDVVAWGWDDKGQVSDIPDGLKAVQIAAGYNLGLALTPDGDVVAWGRDDRWGQVSGIPSGLKAVQIAAGDQHNLALTPDGDVVAWGRNDRGQVSGVPDGLKAVRIAAGSHHSLAITTDGDVVAWGWDDYGQVSGIPDGLKAVQIAGGAYHSLAITPDGDVVAWGQDDKGQVSGVPDGLKAIQVAAGFQHSLALTPDGDVVAWGWNDYGQVSGIPSGLKAVQIAAGYYHSLALSRSYSVETPFNINPFSDITNLQFYDNNLNLLNHEISGGRITIEIPPHTHNINIVVHNPDYEAITTVIFSSPTYLDYNYLDLSQRSSITSLHPISPQISTKTLSNTIKSIYKPLHGDVLIIQTDNDTIYQAISGYKFSAETAMQDVVGLPTSVAASRDGNNIIEGRDLVVNIYTGSDGIKRGTYTTGGKILDVSISEETGLYAVVTAEDGKMYIFSKDAASAWYLLYSSESLQPVAQICSMAAYGNVVSYARSNTLYYFSTTEAVPVDGNIKLSIFHNNRPYENKDVWYEQGGRNKDWSAPERVTTDSYGICYIPVIWGDYVRVTVGDGELEKIIVANPQQTEYILRVVDDAPLRAGAKYFANYDPDRNIIWFYYEDTKFKTHQLHLQMIRLSDNVVVVDEWFTTPEEFPVSYEYQIPDEHVNTNYKINMNCYGSPTYKNTWQVWVGTDEITALPHAIPDAVKTGMWFILILFVAGLFTYVTGPQGAVVVSLMTGFLVLIKWLPLAPSVVAVAIVWAFIGLFGRGGTE
jgi:surface antigen